MIAKELRAINFLGLGEATIQFGNHGLVLIEGVNHDSPTSKSNGASKSSLYEAIHWCLWGTTKRGVKGDDVVNTSSKKEGCSVSLSFDSYRVERYRKHPKHGNELYVLQIAPDGSETNISKGTSKETQLLIEQIVGMSEGTFSKCAHFGQGDVKQFASLTDKELKIVFEEAMGMTFLSEDAAAVSGWIKALQQESRDIADKIAKIQTIINSVDTRIESHKTSIETNKMSIDTLNRNALDTIASIEAEIAKIEGALASGATATPEEPLLKEIQHLESLQDQLRLKIGNLESEISAIRATMAALTAEQSRLNLVRTVGGKCPTCGQSIDDMAAAEVGAARLKTIGLDLARMQSDTKALSAEHARLLDMHRALSAKIVEKTTQLKAIEKANIEITQAAKLVAQRKSTITDIQTRSASSVALHAEVIEHTKKAIDVLIAKKDALLMDVMAAKTKALPVEKEIETLNMLLGILGNGGMKSYIFDSLTPELNKLANTFAQKLDDITLEVSTVSKTKAGELREKFAVNVENRYGAPSYEGNSGGEKQKVNIALSLAFNSIVRSTNPAAPNFIFLDEVFESLDEGSAEPVIELCHTLALEVPTVFLISHQPGLKELVPKTATVEKRGKKAVFSLTI